MRPPKFRDVVWCKFPEWEEPNAPGAKTRPVLVLGAMPDGALVVAAYGTSQAHTAQQDWEVRHEAQRGRLTTFDLLRVFDVPATQEYFPSGLPVLKKFPAERMPEIVAARAAAQAELARRAKRRKK